MRTDVGTFVFRIPSAAGGAKITVEYANGGESLVFHLSQHPPDEEASVQLSGHLLEIEAKQELMQKVWQARENGIAEKWGRDVQCTECGLRRKPFSPFCDGCSED